MRKPLVFFVIWACLTILLAGCSSSNGLEISEIWARPAAAGENGAVYFILSNPGSADVLRSISGDVAMKIEMHVSKMENNMMTMQHQEKVEVPAKQTIEFKPGGLHVMLMGLQKELKPGDTFDLTLQFDQAGAKTVQVTVKEP